MPYESFQPVQSFMLRTITDFDFGTGSTFSQGQRVSTIDGNDVSKQEGDFILWLILEQEFYKAKTRRVKNRTQHDGSEDTSDSIGDEDDGDSDDDDNSRTSDSRRELTDREKIRIAKDYAEEALRTAGVSLVLDDLSDKYRHNMLMQLCRSCDLIPGESIRSAPEIFHALRVSKFRTNFEVLKEIGSGGFGEVFLVTRRGASQLFAVKKTSVSLDSFEDVKVALNESKFLKMLRGHNHIVHLYDYWLEIENTDNANSAPTSHSSGDYFSDEEFGGPLKFYIQLEYCGESLDAWKEVNGRNHVIPQIPLVLLIARQLFDGLSYIHEKVILHLDISPKNIIWKNSSYDQIKIVDFGLAVSGTTLNYPRGTPPYLASSDHPMTAKSDVYSAAVTIIDVAKTVTTHQELIEIIKNKNVDVGDSVLNGLLLRSLDIDISNRPTALEFFRRLTPADNQ